MEREFATRIAQIENIIYELKERGDTFFEDTIRIGRLRDLLNSDKIEREFEDRVVADTARRVDDATGALIDWMVDKDLRQWQRVQEYIDRRRQVGFAEKVVGSTSGQFAYNRDNLLKTVVQEARHVVDSYDRRAEASLIAQDMRTGVGQALAFGGMAAIGVGITLLITSTFIDITGITAAVVSGAIGLFVLPYRKRKAQEQFRARTEELRDRLVEAMEQQFEVELNRSMERIREAIAPYTRFVRLE